MVKICILCQSRGELPFSLFSSVGLGRVINVHIKPKKAKILYIITNFEETTTSERRGMGHVNNRQIGGGGLMGRLKK